MTANGNLSSSHRPEASEPPVVAYAPAIQSRRPSRWAQWTLLGLTGSILLCFGLGWLDRHIEINPAHEYCTRCLALSEITHRTVFGRNWDSIRKIIDTPVAKVIQAYDGCPCAHQWRIYFGRPGTLLGVFVADYFPPHWLMSLNKDPDNLAPALAQRLRDDPGFLDELRAALASSPHGHAENLIDSLTATSQPAGP